MRNVRIITLLLLFITLVFAGCKPEKAPEQTSETQDEPRVSATDKAIVIFFSRAGDQFRVGHVMEGSTSKVAKAIAQKTGADLFEVKPMVDKYNVPYRRLADIAKLEQDGAARPDYVEPAPDLTQYDVIFFGSPVWWGDWPMIMYTFFENNDLQGKKLIPFTTHSGSGLSNFDAKLSRIYPYCTILKGNFFLGEDVQKDFNKIVPDIDKWLLELGFTLRPEETPDEATSAVDETAEVLSE